MRSPVSPKDMQGSGKSWNWFWVVISLATLIVLSSLMPNPGAGAVKEITLDELYAAINDGQIKALNIDAKNGLATGNFQDKKKFKSSFVDGPALEKKVLESKIKVTAVVDEPSPLVSLLIGILPFVLVIGIIWWMFSRRANDPAGGMGGFLTSQKGTVGDWAVATGVAFDDVAGCEEVKEDVKEYINFLQNPLQYAVLGARMPRGLLMVGPPGTGKTLIAKAMAAEAGVPFGYISGSDFIEMFVGVGASRVRLLFKEAKARAPCILFIDELDAIGKMRGADLRTSHTEQEQTLNQILAEMDGFTSDTGILVMAATNHPEILDRALLRPGRFDRRIEVELPDIKSREAILKIHARKIKIAEDADFKEIARATPMASGADLANIINEAAIIATRRRAPAVEQQDLCEGMDKALYGPKKKSAVISPREKEIVAYHEAGHALAAKFTDGCDPISRVTIIPRRGMGGFTLCLPEEDRHIYGKKHLKAQLVYAMGGRAAEMRKFNDESSGARGDFEQATAIAKQMVMELGMSDTVGKRVFVRRAGFLGSVSELVDCSPETQRLIDEAVKSILDESYKAAFAVMADHLNALGALAEALMEKETLTGPEVEEIIKSAEAST